MTGSNTAPRIVIRRKGPEAAAAHGGAWKVAYADFVTAMMAFFLLMWLLNATTEKQRKGLSDYFNPTIVVSRNSAGGADVLAGDSLVDSAQNARSTADQAALQELAVQIDQAMRQRGTERHILAQVFRHVLLRLTDEGLVIELYDTENVSLFDEFSAEPRSETRQLLQLIAEVLQPTTNHLAITNHMRRLPIMRRDVSFWNVSAERAQIAQQILVDQGLDSARIQRLVAFADRKPLLRDPALQRNNRLEIILLRSGL